MAPCICGFPGGPEACRAAFYALQARFRELAGANDMRVWRVMHDVYSVQHEPEFCGRYRGLVMHLGGLCWAIEHGGHENGYRALQRLVSADPWKGVPYPPGPGLPATFGALTIADVTGARDREALIEAIERWANAAWAAYAALHPVARTWVHDALTSPHRS